MSLEGSYTSLVVEYLSRLHCVQIPHYHHAIHTSTAGKGLSCNEVNRSHRVFVVLQLSNDLASTEMGDTHCSVLSTSKSKLLRYIWVKMHGNDRALMKSSPHDCVCALACLGVPHTNTSIKRATDEALAISSKPSNRYGVIVTRKYVHALLLLCVPKPHCGITVASGEYGSFRMPLHPLDITRWPIKATDQLSFLRIVHSDYTVKRSSSEVGAIA
mmetsp:Transcript_6947/g.17635  ORF Transcript_6947/g.17635 Transcript_6947/m.17635 type:complete len:215 (-) Transcript_6947:550-1194(-)